MFDTSNTKISSIIAQKCNFTFVTHFLRLGVGSGAGSVAESVAQSVAQSGAIC